MFSFFIANQTYYNKNPINILKQKQKKFLDCPKSELHQKHKKRLKKWCTKIFLRHLIGSKMARLKIILQQTNMQTKTPLAH